MTTRTKWVLAGAGLLAAIGSVAVYMAASAASKRFEPMVREQAIRYLRERFHADVELTALHVHLPKLSHMQLLMKHERGAKVRVDGEGLSMWFGGSRELPPLFSMKRFSFAFDLDNLRQQQKSVEEVSIEGMEIHVPPKDGAGRPGAPRLPNPSATSSDVIIQNVQIKDAVLVILPKDKTKNPLRFDIAHLRFKSIAPHAPMNYDALLTIPKPPGQVHSHGTFGPWVADEPGDTPVAGNYVFDKADLGVFNGIAGILNSTGTFEGTLGSVHAKGEATVPDFRLKMAGNRVPLWTRFEVLVDGTNGDTVLQPVHAKLGSTTFTTTGAVIKHEGQRRRAISLRVTMPNGDMRDLLRLATKGRPFLEGRITLNTRIDIPPLSGSVKEKLLLDGQYELRDAKFLKSSIQDQLDKLSRKGQGKPKDEEIDEVVSNMAGSFRLENEVMMFRSLSFSVPGARVHLAGEYDLGKNTLDFHGALKLAATVSQTQTGWKRWALKPVDPFFEKNGAGTFLRIKVDGSAQQPKFGLDRGHKEETPAAVPAGRMDAASGR